MEKAHRGRALAEIALGAGLVAKLLVLNTVLAVEAFPTRRASVAATAAVALVCLLPVYRLRERWRLQALLFLSAAISGLLFADVVHFRFFGEPLSVAEVGHGWQVGAVGSTVLRGIEPSDWLLFADVVTVRLVWLFWLRRGTREVTPPVTRRVATRFGFALAGCLALAPVYLVWTDPEEVFFYGTRRREIVAALGVLPYHVYDATTYTRRRLGRLRVGAADRDRVRRFFDTRRAAPPQQTGFFGRARGRNVIVVMAESLTSAPLGLSVEGQPVTPELTRFARESLHFTNVFEQTNVGTTSDGEFLSIQGLLPLPNGVVATRYPSNTFAGLPAVLGRHGYETLSASVVSGDFWNMRGMHHNLGFARSLFEHDFLPGPTIGMGLADAAFFDQMEAGLRALPEPFMAYLLTLSNHDPYVLPASEPHLNVGALTGTTVGRYLQTVHYFDGAFGRFIDCLRESGLLDRSIVVVYGDHRAFWEDTPQLPPLAGVSPKDSWNVWALEHRVPLFIRLPHGEGAGTIPDAAGQLDIPPTVLGLLGVPWAGEVMLGRDLLGTEKPFVAFRDGSVIDGHSAFIDSTERETRGCFDIRTGERIDCQPLAAARRQGREQMEISDLVVRGDLVTELRRPTVTAPRRTLVIGHRGNPEAAPENTIASILSAFEAGADFAEVDVRVSRDGVPVIFHDETLERTTNGKGALADHTLAELKALDAGAWKGGAFAGERIPTLVEALRAARGKGRLFLDVPVSGIGALLARALQETGVSPRDTVIATWDADQRRDIVAHLPMATIVHSEGAPPVWDAGFFASQRTGGVHIFDVGNWSPPFVRDAHAAGFKVWAYTINDPAAMRELVRNGIDAFETDLPRLGAGITRETAGK